jgi:hypothetical protein
MTAPAAAMYASGNSMFDRDRKFIYWPALHLNKGQDFGFTPNKRPDYRKPIATWAY